MANLTVPGVKVQEISTLPPSVAPVDTAIPVFVGYTESAVAPIKKISSMLEYEQYFGGPSLISVSVALTDNLLTDTSVTIDNPTPTYLMYYSVKSFYDNGGGECYIASAGTYLSMSPFLVKEDITTMLSDYVSREDEPTLIVVPDAINLSSSDYAYVYDAALTQCAALKDRFTILDAFPPGEKEVSRLTMQTDTTVLNGDYVVFQNASGTKFAYWLKVGSGVAPTSTPYANVPADNKIAVVIAADATNTAIASAVLAAVPTITTWSTSGIVIANAGTGVLSLTQKNSGNILAPVSYNNAGTAAAGKTTVTTYYEGVNDDNIIAIRSALGNNNLKYGAAYYPRLNSVYAPSTSNAKITVSTDSGDFSSSVLSTLITSHSDIFKDTFVSQILSAVSAATANYPVVIGASAAIAGVYATIDYNVGVWKAPANVSISGISSTTLNVGDDLQGQLNVDATSGKSINAIRYFSGKGNLVWGARTLAGNDNDWRYVNVRRLLIFVEESCSKASSQFVFEPNTAQTWQRMKGMIDNFLTNLWRQGALAGAKPEDAFFVRVGLGTTMTAQDILDGNMIVEIGVCPSRPAEFIVLKFSHKLQVS